MQKFAELADMIAARVAYCHKEVLTSKEAAQYTGLSQAHLYQLTCRKEIPHYKPRGGMIYFNRKELEAWLLRNRISTDLELEQMAHRHTAQKGGVI